MFDFLQNTNLVKEWVISNLLWEILFLIIFVLFLKFIPGITRAIRISKTILKENRDTRGNSWGKYLADRFINIWYSNDKQPLEHQSGRFYNKTFNNPNSRHHMDKIDKDLKDLDLIQILNIQEAGQVVNPIKNWRNRLIVEITKFYLIHFIGDNPQYYRDIKDQAGK